MDKGTNYYVVLECQRDASQAAIQQAFRRLAKKWHPDRSQKPEAREKFIEVATAYQILGDQEKRSVYDRLLAKQSMNFDEYVASVAKWKHAAEKRSQKWSSQRFEKFSSVLLKVDQVLQSAMYKAGHFLKGDSWTSDAIIRIAKITGLGYALVGLWLAVIGAPLFYFLFFYLVRRSPARAEFLGAFLWVLQLVLVLIWLVLIDLLHPVVHTLFWADQLLLLWVGWKLNNFIKVEKSCNGQ